MSQQYPNTLDVLAKELEWHNAVCREIYAEREQIRSDFFFELMMGIEPAMEKYAEAEARARKLPVLPNYWPFHEPVVYQGLNETRQAVYRAIIEDRRLNRAPTGKVYIFRQGDHVKIGFTQGHVADRRARLQTGSPASIEYVVDCPGSRHVERHLHYVLKRKRLNGEWFRIDDDIGFLVRFMMLLNQARKKQEERLAESVSAAVNSTPPRIDPTARVSL